eukprot:9493489-Pyramimonas_sp.AAC.1
MEKYVQATVEFVLEGIEDDQITKKLKQTVPYTNLNMVTQLCYLLEALLKEEKNITDTAVLEAVFVFSMVRVTIRFSGGRDVA